MGTFMQVYYEKPLLPDYSQNSLACEKEINCATKEKTRYPQFLQHSTRLATFVNCPFFTDHQEAANLGFFYKGLGDRVCCYECGVTLSLWKRDDDPLLEHIRYSPECKHLAAIVDTDTLKDCKTHLQHVRTKEARQGATGVRLENPVAQEERILVRSPQYSSLDVRLSTFVTFPVINGLDVHRIAAAGFYYTGDKDVVRCYTCDGGLKQWVAGDDPWDEHYTWFPNCSYLKQSNYNQAGKKNKPESSCKKAQLQLRKANEARQDATDVRIGHQDAVRCYACNCGFNQCEQGDETCDEYFKLFQDCPHFEKFKYKTSRRTTKTETETTNVSKTSEEKPLSSVGMASLSEVIEQSRNEFTFQKQENKPKKSEVLSDLNPSSALIDLEFGYSRRSVTMAIKELKRRGKTSFAAKDILQVLFSFEDRGIRLPTDNDVIERDRKNSILSDLQKVSSKDLDSEEQLTWEQINKTMTLETRDKGKSSFTAGDIIQTLMSFEDRGIRLPADDDGDKVSDSNNPKGCSTL